ncbi:MAG TPA: radical SAM protein [Candidatus Hydrogenedentes bacterium]|nr:radical SAM protein [Candidatus Hydrogenedentota bacterium]HOS01768.1 radical SAM protein [Candidatus Hydrogenedentota bacterium]
MTDFSGGKYNELDCLFVHVPKCANEYLPLGEFLNITYAPMGLLALAHQARRRGFRAEIVHLGVEWMLDRNYTLAAEFAERRIAAAGLPLYWHYQAYDVLQVAKAIKAVSPETFVFLGGLTASYFAEEILRSFPCVDAVVQGHGETPVIALLEQLQRDTPDLGRVPSLYSRCGAEIRRSDDSYVAEQADLDDLVFADFSSLRHAETYIASFGFPLAFSKEYDEDEHKARNTMGRTFFPLCTGRGCHAECVYCGGSAGTLHRANVRNRVLWRSPDRVVDDVRRAVDAGYRTISLCFDPTPSVDDYYVDLFAKLRRDKVAVDVYFESWALPTRRFLETFARTFPTEHSYVALSPDSGNERVRRLNKGFFYTNDQLRDSLRTARDLGVQADVFFTIALAGETLKEALETRDLITELRDAYDNIRRLMTWTVQLEPGSPQYEHPERYNIITDRQCFEDFRRAHGGPHADTYSSLGFKINDYFGDERDGGGILDFEAHIQHLKCMEFCFLAPDPRQRLTPEQSRRHCLERRRAIAARRGCATEQRLIDDQHRYADARAALRKEGPSMRPEWT